jgi:hypothetical protein
MKKHFLLWVYALCCFIAAPLSAQTGNPTINIQGTLKDATGKSIDDGKYQVTFQLFSGETGGSLVWEETAEVETAGGIYSYNLGSYTPFDQVIFQSTVYMGVIFNGFELTPRTKLNYAPYAFASNTAQTAACTGAPGDIKYSILNPTDFAQVNGDCWVPLNGATLPASSALRMLTGRTTLPDGSGLFIQGQEFSNGQDNDPGRTPDSPVATLQADDFKSHTHTIGNGGQHTHPFIDYYLGNGNVSAAVSQTEVNYSGGNDATQLTFDPWPNFNHRVLPNGDHTHTVNSSGGGSETRSKNINLWIYICIN